jgi:Flp pilus assembly protein TadD
VDLADVLATMGRIDEAEREYRQAIQTTVDPDVRSAALEALRSLQR